MRQHALPFQRETQLRAGHSHCQTGPESPLTDPTFSAGSRLSPTDACWSTSATWPPTCSTTTSLRSRSTDVDLGAGAGRCCTRVTSPLVMCHAVFSGIDDLELRARMVRFGQ